MSAPDFSGLTDAEKRKLMGDIVNKMHGARTKRAALESAIGPNPCLPGESDGGSLDELWKLLELAIGCVLIEALAEGVE